MRKHSEILIFIDVQQAIDAGITFELSSNGVILTAGDERGYLSPKFFMRVENSRGVPLPGWENSPDVRNEAAASSLVGQPQTETSGDLR
jgi:2'-phosphotransferase